MDIKYVSDNLINDKSRKRIFKILLLIILVMLKFKALKLPYG